MRIRRFSAFALTLFAAALAAPLARAEGVFSLSGGGSFSQLRQNFPSGQWVYLSAQFNQLGSAGVGARFGHNKQGLFLLEGRADRRTYVPPAGFTVAGNQKTLFDFRALTSVSNDFFKLTGILSYSREPYLEELGANSLALHTMDVMSATGGIGYYLFNTKDVSADIGAQGMYYLPHARNAGGAVIHHGYGVGGLAEVQFGKKTVWTIQGSYLLKTFSMSSGEPKSLQLNLIVGMLIPF